MHNVKYSELMRLSQTLGCIKISKLCTHVT